MLFTSALALCLAVTPLAAAFPTHPDDVRSIHELSQTELDDLVKRWDGTFPGASAPPAQISDTSAKLVNDAAHPYAAPKSTDIRGPCPGLNTLANHGYLPRNGIATPQQIVAAVQQGFNMAQDLAVFIAYGAHLAQGNQLTNLISIGANTSQTGPAPPAPANAGGLSFHGIFEGDASTTRSDKYLGDNANFNETLFQVFIDMSNKYGGGYYNDAAAIQVRYARWLDSKTRNPTFNFLTPRIFTAYGESVFPYRFFVNASSSTALDLTTARSFFQKAQFPTNFFRRSGAFGIDGMTGDVIDLALKKYIQAGQNQGLGNYVTPSGEQGLLGRVCGVYQKAIGSILPGLYPPAKTTGALRTAVAANAHYFFVAINPSNNANCPELFPYN